MAEPDHCNLKKMLIQNMFFKVIQICFNYIEIKNIATHIVIYNVYISATFRFHFSIKSLIGPGSIQFQLICWEITNVCYSLAGEA